MLCHDFQFLAIRETKENPGEMAVISGIIYLER